MNNGAPGSASGGEGQVAGGTSVPGQQAQAGAQQQQQPKRQVPLYKPEQMRGLPDNFTAQEKEKWEHGLRSLWSQVEKNPPDSTQHQEARRKLFDFSKTLTQKLHNFKAQQQMQQKTAMAAKPGTAQGLAPSGQMDATANPNPQQQQPQQRPPQKISPKLMDHVSNFPYVLPANLTSGTPEANKWLQETKTRYLRGLSAMESASGRIAALDSAVQKRVADSKPLNADEEKDYKEKKEAVQKNYNEAKTFVENFRASHMRAASAANAAAGSSTTGMSVPGNNEQQMNLQPGASTEDAINTSNPNNTGLGVAGQGRPQMQQPPNPALQNTQTINAAIEAAKNQQMAATRPAISGGDVQMGNTQFSGSGAVNTNNTIQTTQLPQSTQTTGIKMEPHTNPPPQINTAVSQIQHNHRQSIGSAAGNINSPQSAIPQSAGPQSAGVQGPIRPLTQQAAFQLAARSYSSGPGTGTPGVISHSHPHSSTTPRETPNVMTNKMPIPKHLPERATQPIQPVNASQARPSYTGGPSNSSNGVLGQPVLAKTPGYYLEVGGEHVLNKKKLDELVRQVTGGGEASEGLSADVEESILNVADNFVDQVLQTACKHAKERGSKVLEIRDIQLTLERVYNIRIPGYSSDEIRTVRKIQPAPAWISKMSAVQAAKVTGGKSGE